MREETRDMTIEMRMVYIEWTKLDAYAEALKSRCFIRRKTIADAILAANFKREEFWQDLTREGPDTKGASAGIRRGYAVRFTWEGPRGRKG